ncbi:MAG: hypothetical protein JO256_13270 [Alphaproteobacteria bacterium]|nr:hypothetical protein [Alphaproteobacteria bacterium]
MRRLIVAFLLFGAATAALAQPQPNGPIETVTSEAQRAQDDSVARTAVGALLAESQSMQGEFARWKAPVCPHVYGLTPVAAWLVEHRIKEIAAQVGAPVDRNDPCTPNIGIIVTPNPQRSFDSLAARAPELVISSTRRTKVEYPVETWYAGLLRDYNGKASLDESWEDAGLDGPPYVPAQLSRLSTGQTAEMGAATVLVNAGAVTGMELGTLADYIALQTMTQTLMNGRCQPVPSIANLMLKNCDPANHVERLSDIDIALLTGLYASEERPEVLQRQRIIGAMKRSLQEQRAR